MTKKTTTTRIDKKLDMKLRIHFPDVERSQLLNIMYETSALRPEVWLRKPSKILNDLFKNEKTKKKR